MIINFKQHISLYLFFIFSLLFSNNTKIHLFELDNIYYFSAQEFSQLKNYKSISYNDKSKIEIFYPNNKLTFSHNSTFVKYDNTIYHMATPAILKDSIFYIPINSFTRLAQQLNIHSFIINKKDMKIQILEPEDISNNDSEISITPYSPANTQWKIQTIVIDPGHGGKDPGAIGYHSMKEKHIVLDISKELGDYITQNMPDMDVIYTREDDTFLGLKNRTSIANKNGGHIFISIHANASSAKSARGYEIFLLQPNSVNDAIDVAIRENASIAFEKDPKQYNQNQIIATLSQNAFLKESEQLAIFVQNALKKELPKTRNRGIKQAGFHVLVGASMPNILIEVGFLTNKSEAQLLGKSYYRKQLAHGIYLGIKSYIENYNNQNMIK